MSKTRTILHYPRLDTVLMVENFIKNSKEDLTKNKLFRNLPKQVQYQTLLLILEYLEASNKITFDKSTIIWIGSNKKLDYLISKGKAY